MATHADTKSQTGKISRISLFRMMFLRSMTMEEIRKELHTSKTAVCEYAERWGLNGISPGTSEYNALRELAGSA